MRIQEIAYNYGTFPKKELQELIDHRDEVIPDLLAVLENTCENAEVLAEDEDYFAHIYAMFLLAQFREPKAYPLIYRLLHNSSETLEHLLGDFLCEGLPQVLASVCDGNIEPLQQIIENPQMYEYVRSSALSSLVILVAWELKSREEIAAYFLSLFQGKLEREYSYVWSALAIESCHLYPFEMTDEIKRAYEDELIDPFIISYDDIQETLDSGKEAAINDLYQNKNNTYRLIDNTVEELENWACFSGMDEDFPEMRKSFDEKWHFEEPRTEIQVPYRKEIKVGRNDPCPCGSGKKYKKCCGQS
ncbi:MAG: DUF1186 domain-containing protein [Peptococcaceae bacterium]|nr:DUF1186 domain-containing protein [Peptococcaceae bacterium]